MEGDEDVVGVASGVATVSEPDNGIPADDLQTETNSRRHAAEAQEAAPAGTDDERVHDPSWLRLIRWLTVEERLFFFVGILIGVLFGALALFDAGTLGSIVAGFLLLCMHACVPIYARRIADRVAMSEDDRRSERATAGRTSTLVLAFILWVAIVVAIDRWILRLPIPAWRKWVLLGAGGLVLLGVTLVEAIGFLRAHRHGREKPVSKRVRSNGPGGPRPEAAFSSESNALARTMQRSRRAVFGFGRWCWSSALEDIPRFVVSAAGGAAAVVVAVGVAGYYNQRDTDDDAIAIDPITSFMADEDGLSYVALGESYSAGEGLDARIAGPDSRCHRSADAYPLFVARALGGVRDPGSPGLSQARLRVPSSVHLEFRACAGAVSADIDLGLVGGWPAQIDSAPRPDVDLVTITIGGNDVIFSDVVQACMLYDDCLSDTFVPRDLDRSRPSIGYPPVQDLEGWAHAAITRVKANLARVYGNLRETYPNARIVVIGYPYLFHGEPARQSLPDLDCWTVMRRISEGERSGIRSLTDELNAAIVEVINRNRRLRIEFVSTVAAWHRHEPCADWGQYTNAVKPTLQLLSPVDGGSFHPNDQGHRQIARLLSCYLNEVARPPVTGARIRQVYGSAEPPADVEENAAQACDVLLAVERND